MGTSITSGRWKLDFNERILWRDKTIDSYDDRYGSDSLLRPSGRIRPATEHG